MSLFFLRDVVRIYVFFISFHLLEINCSYFVIANLVLIDDIYMMRLLLQFFHICLHVLFIFSLYAHASYIWYAIFISASH